MRGSARGARRWLGAMVGVVVFAATAALAEGTVQTVPGSRVQLAPPEGFEPAVEFTGFAAPASGSSIVITEMPPEAFAELDGAFQSGLRYQGMRLGTREDLTVMEHPSVFIRASQVSRGIAYSKWLLLVGAPDLTALVVGNAPSRAVTEETGTVMRDALLSIAFRPADAVDPMEALPFTLDIAPSFVVDNVMQGNTLALKTADEADGRPSLFVAAAPPNDVCSELVESGQNGYFAGLVRAMPGFEMGELEQPAPITIAGLKGLVATAKGADVNTGEPLSVFQVVLFDDCRYVRFVGETPDNDQAGERIAEFMAMAQSFARKYP